MDGAPLAVTIELPHVGESVVEGTIGKWLKQPGDAVERYEPLVEVITDKVTMEVPSPVNGSLLRVIAQEGETIPMGGAHRRDGDRRSPSHNSAPHHLRKLITVGPESQPVTTTGYLIKDVPPVGPTGGGPAPADAPPGGGPGSGGPRVSPAVRRLVKEHGIDLSLVRGTGMGRAHHPG